MNNSYENKLAFLAHCNGPLQQKRYRLQGKHIAITDARELCHHFRGVRREVMYLLTEGGVTGCAH